MTTLFVCLIALIVARVNSFSCDDAVKLVQKEGHHVQSCRLVHGNPIITFQQTKSSTVGPIDCETIPDIYTKRNQSVTDCLEVGGSAFFRIDKYYAWQDAWGACKVLPLGHLATITNLFEFRAMSTLIESMNHVVNKFNAWIGLSDEDVEGEYRWTEDGSLAVYKKFLLSEPDGGTAANCIFGTRNNAHLAYYLGNTGWGDDACSSAYMPICQIAIVKPANSSSL